MLSAFILAVHSYSALHLAALLRLATIVGESSNETQRQSRNRFGGSQRFAGAKQVVDRSVSTLKLTPQLILEVLPRLMNTMVVILVDKGVEHADEALRGYCQLHRLFVALVQHLPKLAQEVHHRLRSFISDSEMRSKSECPNLGELLPLLSVCEEVGWLDIVQPLMEESFARSVLWACRDVPELAAIAKKSGAKITQDLQKMTRSGAADTDMLNKIFTACSVSRRLYSFHCCFLRLVAHPHGAKLAEIARCYDRTLGTPPRHMRSKMAALLGQIEAAKTWPEYFDSVCLRRVSPETLQSMWLRSVRSSLSAGYHTTRTDFSRIQQSGVSSILLRGQSYPRIVFCIDVSGSMGSSFLDVATGQETSRLDFVKKDLQGIFANQLTHRQQFTLVKFDHRARMWSNGLQQATTANLQAASQHVDEWFPDGGTDFEQALTVAFGVPDVQAVYLLSDGEVYGGEMEHLIQRARVLSRNGAVHCHTTAFFAPASGQAVMEGIARATGGSYVKYGESEW